MPPIQIPRSTILILVYIFLVMGACDKVKNPLSQQEIISNVEVDSVRLLALGDSYTIGTSVPSSERWPNQLADSLMEHGVVVKEVRIIAGNGWTTGDLLNAINNQDLKSGYDLVGLLIGVNNQFQGRSTSEYENQFRQLLEIALTLADENAKRVFTISIPD